MKAPDRVLNARLKLMLDEPYLASAIARLPFRDASDREWCELIATDGYYIYFNRQALESIEEQYLPFLIAHEVMHCVLGHIGRRGGRNREIWNYAIDYATNNLLVELGLRRPPIGLFDDRYRQLTAEEIYDLLIASAKPLPSRVLVALNAIDGAKHRGTRPSKKENTAASARAVDGGTDLHIEAGDIAGRDVREDYFPSAGERVRIQAALATPIEAQLRGNTPGRSSSEVRAAGRNKVPWQTLLARFVSGMRRSDYRLWPPNRKHLWRGLYLPSVGAPGPQLLVVAVDTSGSMNDLQIAQILREISGLCAVTECTLVLIQCDAAVQSVEVYEPYEEPAFIADPAEKYQIHGRGGTDFRPVFDWVREQDELPMGTLDGLIYCTDGWGSFPDSEPDYPVLWIACGRPEREFPFGSVISI